jgi:hypothetical protein
MKHCRTCDVLFKTNSKRPVCDSCKYKRHKKWIVNNRDRLNKNHKKWYANNLDKERERRRAWYRVNTDEILERSRKCRKIPENLKKERIRKRKYRETHNLYRKSISFKMRHNISCRIRTELVRFKSKKGNASISRFLPYNIRELIRHLESLFEPWMNWNNWGIYNSKTWNDNDCSTWTWQIDHIIPQSTLPFDSMEHTNFKKCWSLENLRPLSAKLNHSDGIYRRRHNVSM